MKLNLQQNQHLSRAVLPPLSCVPLQKPRLSLTCNSLPLGRPPCFGATLLRVHQSVVYTGLRQPRPVHGVVAAWQQPQLAAQAAGLGRGLFGFWLPVLLVLCLTLATLAASFVAFVLYIRPVLKAAERAAEAAEIASRQMESAAQEMEKAAVVMSGDLPVTLLEMEKASKEFEILGRQLNRFTRALTQSPAEAVVSTTSTIQENTLNGIQRVVDDVSSLANANTWISRWRSRSAAGGEDGGPPVAPLPPAPPRSTGDAAERELFRVEAPWEQQQPKKKDGLQGTTTATAAAAATGAPAAASGTSKLRPLAAASAPAQSQQQQRQQQEALKRVQQASPRGAAGKEQAGAVAGGAVRAPAAGQAPSLQRHGKLQDPAADGFAKQGSSSRNSASAMKAAVVAQVRAGGGGRNEEERAATAAVLAALERAQRAAEQAATATGALKATTDRAERKGTLKGKQNERH